jgi:hypothetical protein
MTPLRVPLGRRNAPVVVRISMPLWRCHSALFSALLAYIGLLDERRGGCVEGCQGW